jgi:hypothetical protein
MAQHAEVTAGSQRRRRQNGRPKAAGRSPQRSRISNGTALLPGIDGRSAAARRYKDLVHAFVSDAGGADVCSEVKLGLIRRLASVTVQSEMLEAKMASGIDIDVGTLCTLASTVVRLSQRLGLNRVARDVTPAPTLHQYLRDKQREASA